MTPLTLAFLWMAAAAAAAPPDDRPHVAILGLGEGKFALAVEASLVDTLDRYRWTTSDAVARAVPSPPDRSLPDAHVALLAAVYLSGTCVASPGGWRCQLSGQRPDGELAFRFVVAGDGTAARAHRPIAERLGAELREALPRPSAGPLPEALVRPLRLLFGAGPTFDGDVDLNGSLYHYFGERGEWHVGLGFYSTTLRFGEDFEQETGSSYEWVDRRYQVALRPVGYEFALANGFSVTGAVEAVLGRANRRYYDTAKCGAGYDDTDETCDAAGLPDGSIVYGQSRTRILSARGDLLVGPSWQSGRLIVELLGRYTPIMVEDYSGRAESVETGGTFGFTSTTLNGYGGALTADLGGLLLGVDLYLLVDYAHVTWEESFEGTKEADGRESRLRLKGGLGFPFLALGEVYPMIGLVSSTIDRFTTPVGGTEVRDPFPSVLALSFDLRTL